MCIEGMRGITSVGRILISRGVPKTLVDQIRQLSLTTHNTNTRGHIKLRTADSNLQKLKHIKYSDEFIQKEVTRHKLNTRRLANMMGEDPAAFGSNDIKRSIRYLFPSDLDEDSLPTMDDPTKVYTSRLRIHWDEANRPLHYLYYTKRPYAFELLHDTFQYVLDARKQVPMEDNHKSINVEGTRWMTMSELSSEVLHGEVLNDAVYNQIISQFEKLLEEDCSFIAEEFVMKHRKAIPQITMLDNILEATNMDDGRKYVVEQGQKKSAMAKVKLIYPGTGKIVVNELELHKYFRFIDDRRTVLSPFSFLRQLGVYDVEAAVEGGVTGPASIGRKYSTDDPGIPSSSQAVAIRLAIARGLRTFINAKEIEMMRRAGLLTLDRRWRERKVYGQHRARKKHTWKRR